MHRSDNSVVAQIVEVSGTSGPVWRDALRPDDFRIERIVAAVDCGSVLDPDFVRAQVEGGVGFGLSGALYQQIRLDGTGRVVERNFDRYRLLRMPDMPRAIDVHFVDSQEPPTGIGEPGSVPVVAALVNALERMGHAPVQRFPLFEAPIA